MSMSYERIAIARKDSDYKYRPDCTCGACKDHRNNLVENLLPIARRLLNEIRTGRRSRGVTVTDLRIVAEKERILFGTEERTLMSNLGRVFKLAGGFRNGYYRNDVRRSSLPITHGNLQIIWYPWR